LAPASWHRLPKHEQGYTALAASPDGKLVAAACGNGDVYIIQTETLATKRVHQNENKSMNAVAFSPNGEWIAVTGNDRQVTLISTKNEFRHAIADLPHRGKCLAFTPDGRRLAVGGGFRTVQIFQVPNLQKISAVDLESSVVASLCWSNSGDILACGLNNGAISVCNAESHLVRRLLGHRGSVDILAFSPDDQTLISSNGDCLRIWHVPTARSMGIMYQSEQYSRITDAVFDGEDLILGKFVPSDGIDPSGVFRWNR
jgi:WD40 repeat protein